MGREGEGTEGGVAAAGVTEEEVGRGAATAPRLQDLRQVRGGRELGQ